VACQVLFKKKIKNPFFCSQCSVLKVTKGGKERKIGQKKNGDRLLFLVALRGAQRRGNLTNYI
jgi:hypothetical protein